MEKNKLVLWIYTIIAIAVGAALLINGLIYFYNYWTDTETDIIILVIALAIGMFEAIIGGMLLKVGIGNIALLASKKEEVQENSTKSDNNDTTVNEKKIHNKKPEQIFRIISVLCFVSCAIFLITPMYFAALNDTWENIFILVPLFAGLMLIFLIAGIPVTKLEKKKKISDVKKPLCYELVFKLLGIYCLILNIIYFFDIPSLVCFSILLAAELVRLVYVIKCLAKKNPVNEAVLATNEPTSNDLGIDDRFINDSSDKDVSKD